MYSDVTELRIQRTQPRIDFVFHLFICMKRLAIQMFLSMQKQMEMAVY